jgi:hypothetical protein
MVDPASMEDCQMSHEEIVALICTTLEAAGVDGVPGRLALLDVIMTSLAWEASDQADATVRLHELVAAYRQRVLERTAQQEYASGLYRAH